MLLSSRRDGPDRQDTVVYAFLMGFLMNPVTSIGVPLIMQL